MSLIKCTECGKEFSDKATACPNCGCPTEIIQQELETINKLTKNELIDETKKRENRKFHNRDWIPLNSKISFKTEQNKLVIKDLTTENNSEIIFMIYDIDKIILNSDNSLTVQVFGTNKTTAPFDYVNLEALDALEEIAEEIDINIDFIDYEPSNLINDEIDNYELNDSGTTIINTFFPSIVKTRIIDGDSRKSATSSIVRGAVGGALLGPIGLIGGAVSGKNKKTTTFLIYYSNGSKKIITVKNRSFEYKKYIQYLE